MHSYLFIFLLFAVFKSFWTLQCVDHNQKPVDWFIVYKLPRIEKDPNNLIKQGAAYTYITSLENKAWEFSDISINDTKSIIGLNLEPYFKEPSTLHIFYNDETPDGSINFKKGHTKGLVLGDNTGGFWLIHSVPHFPPINANTYYYPSSGFVYGQSFLCISLDLDNLNKVGIQLQYNTPNIYSQNIPVNLKSRLPKLDEVVHDVTINQAPWYHLQMLISKEGTRFFSFAKNSKFAKELYADWVAPTFNISLLVETWPNGPGRIHSQCDEHFSVNNVLTVNIPPANVSFKCSTDHSKWAVVSKDNLIAKWVCIGDINRAVSQRQRGGGTVCFNNDKATDIYQNSISEVEPCPKKSIKDNLIFYRFFRYYEV